jgi:hypothetical protein
MGQVSKIISTFIGYQFICRHFTSMDVKFTNIGPCEYLVNTWTLLHTQYLHFEKLITILDPKNKMWGFGKNTLKSLKIVLTNYNFLHFKNLTRCVHQIWWKYCKLWKFWKFWNLMYLILQKYSIKDEYFVRDDIFALK